MSPVSTRPPVPPAYDHVRQRAVCVFFWPVLHVAPGSYKLPNKNLFSKWMVGPKKLKHIHHGTVAIKKIYVMSSFLRERTDVCEKSRESSKSSSEMVPEFQSISKHCLGLSHKTVTERKPSISVMRIRLCLQVASQRKERNGEQYRQNNEQPGLAWTQPTNKPPASSWSPRSTDRMPAACRCQSQSRARAERATQPIL